MKLKTVLIALILILGLSIPAHTDDATFRICRLAYHSAAFADYFTTYHASFNMRFEEQNLITRLYWRTPSAFCAFKTLETLALDRLFRFIYKKSKPLGFAVIAIFTIVRITAFKGNMRVMCAAGR